MSTYRGKESAEVRQKRWKDRENRPDDPSIKANLESVDWVAAAKDPALLAATKVAMDNTPLRGGDFAKAWSAATPEDKAQVMVYRPLFPSCNPFLEATLVE